MQFFVEHQFPDPVFWQQYEQLWEHSSSRSVFQSPHFIRFMAKRQASDLAVVQFRKDSVLKAAAFFSKTDGVYRFLSDVRSDHNFFVFHRDCSNGDVQDFFNALFAHVCRERWKLAIDKQPTEAPYLPFLLTEAKTSSLFWTRTRQSVCPMLRGETPEALADGLIKSKKAQRNIKALAKQQEIQFEVFQCDTGLDGWVDGFCTLHISRWAGTPTPSRYERAGERDFLADCMRCWVRDGALIRFSLCFGDHRAAYCWGFVEGNKFIAHAQAYDPAFSRNSPIKVLINYIGQWVAGQPIDTMDFGYGSDEYKYAYANCDLHLHSFLATSWWNMPFFLKTRLGVTIRNNPRLYRFLKTGVWPLFKKTSTVTAKPM
jgi:hypothetical protein